MIRTFIKVAVVVAALTVPTTARAQPFIDFQFATTGDVFGTNFGNVTVGDTISLRVYVQQVGGNPLGSDGGMIGYAARIRFDDPLGSGTPSNIARLLDMGVPPGPPSGSFGPDLTPNIPSGGFATINGTNSFSGVMNVGANINGPGVLPDVNGRILIGTVRFTALAPGSFSFRAEDPNPASNGDFTTFTSNNRIDGFLRSATASFTVVPVPEPASLALAGVGAAALATMRRRRLAAV